MTTKSVRVRFAPSPTGNLHLGSARTVLFNWLFAQAQGGSFIVRIEDTDRARSADEYEKAILNDLQWLGLDWNEGPGTSGEFGPYYQSKRQDIYRKVAQKLLDERKAYYCYCSMQELEEERKAALAEGQTPVYGGRCVRLTGDEKKRLEQAGRKPVVRFKVPAQKIVINDLINGHVEFNSDVIGDFILLRSDGTASFNFANVVDDARMGITHVIRGNDHLSNTPRHILLFEALGEKPPYFAHHSLLLGTDHTKMSKRHGATAVFEYREQGYLPNALMNYLALLSWSPGDDREIFTPEQLMGEFSLDRISKSPAIFDIDKLRWINKQHILGTELKTLTSLALPFLREKGMNDQELLKKSDDPGFIDLTNKVKMVQDRLTILSDLPGQLKVLFLDSIEFTDEARRVLMESDSRLVLESLAAILEVVNDLDEDRGREALKELAQAMKIHNIKGKSLYLPVRLALTGEASGPHLYSLLAGLGKEKSLARIESALEKCKIA